MEKKPAEQGRGPSPTIRLTLFGIFVALLMLQLGIVIYGARLGAAGRADFRHLYTASYMVRSGHAADIYNYDVTAGFQARVVGPEIMPPFDHLAYETLFFVPLSFLGYRSAFFVFFAVNLLLLSIAAVVCRPYFSPLATVAPWLPCAPFVCFLPVSITLIQGQDSIILLAIAVASFVLLQRKRELGAGAILALGLFKFQFVVPIMLLFLLWRRWRFVAGGVFAGIVLACISVWVTGVAALRIYTGTLFSMSVGLTTQLQKLRYGTFPIHMMNLRGFISSVGANHVPGTVIHVAIVVCSVLVILIASRMGPSLSVAIVAAALVSYHGLIHDMSILIIPIGLALGFSIARKNGWLGVSAAVLLLAPSVVVLFPAHLYFWVTIPLLAFFWNLREISAWEAAPELVPVTSTEAARRSNRLQAP